MAVTDSQTLQRLRREEGVAEQQGRQASNIAVILKIIHSMMPLGRRLTFFSPRPRRCGSRLSGSKPNDLAQHEKDRHGHRQQVGWAGID